MDNLLFRAINNVDLYIYRYKKRSPEEIDAMTPLEIYNNWVLSSGFSVQTQENVLYLIDHISLYSKMSINKMRASLKREGLI